MRQAVAYYRVSTQRQGRSGLGLEAQQSAVATYCKANEYDLIREFIEVKSTRKFQTRLFEALDYCKRQNATLVVARLDSLLDGVEEAHNATRKFRSGNGSFKIVDVNLRKLLGENIPCSVNTVITNQNLAGLPDLTRYLIALDVPFRYSIVKGEKIDAELLEEYLLESYSIMQDAIETGWRFSRRHQFCDLKPYDLGFQTCASGFSGGAIYVDGSLKYCHVHFGNDAEKSHTIFESGLDLVDMIEQGAHYEGDKSEDCKRCIYKSICTSGCPVYRVNGKDPQCSIYHKFIPMFYELTARERLNLLRKYEIV